MTVVLSINNINEYFEKFFLNFSGLVYAEDEPKKLTNQLIKLSKDFCDSLGNGLFLEALGESGGFSSIFKVLSEVDGKKSKVYVNDVSLHLDTGFNPFVTEVIGKKEESEKPIWISDFQSWLPGKLARFWNSGALTKPWIEAKYWPEAIIISSSLMRPIIGSLLTFLHDICVGPHFTKVFGSFICKQNSYNFYQIEEASTVRFDKFLGENKVKTEDLLIWTLQALYSFGIMYEYFGLTGMDLHLANFMLTQIPKKSTQYHEYFYSGMDVSKASSWKYDISYLHLPQKYLVVKNNHWLFKMIDYDAYIIDRAKSGSTYDQIRIPLIQTDTDSLIVSDSVPGKYGAANILTEDNYDLSQISGTYFLLSLIFFFVDQQGMEKPPKIDLSYGEDFLMILLQLGILPPKELEKEISYWQEHSKGMKYRCLHRFNFHYPRLSSQTTLLGDFIRLLLKLGFLRSEKDTLFLGSAKIDDTTIRVEPTKVIHSRMNIFLTKEYPPISEWCSEDAQKCQKALSDISKYHDIGYQATRKLGPTIPVSRDFKFPAGDIRSYQYIPGIGSSGVGTYRKNLRMFRKDRPRYPGKALENIIFHVIVPKGLPKIQMAQNESLLRSAKKMKCDLAINGTYFIFALDLTTPTNFLNPLKKEHLFLPNGFFYSIDEPQFNGDLNPVPPPFEDEYAVIYIKNNDFHLMKYSNFLSKHVTYGSVYTYYTSSGEYLKYFRKIAFDEDHGIKIPKIKKGSDIFYDYATCGGPILVWNKKIVFTKEKLTEKFLFEANTPEQNEYIFKKYHYKNKLVKDKYFRIYKDSPTEHKYLWDLNEPDVGYFKKPIANSLTNLTVFCMKDDSPYFILFEGRGFGSVGIDKISAAHICFQLGMDYALTLDGGFSTNAVYRDSEGYHKLLYDDSRRLGNVFTFTVGKS